jgi:ubiquinone/menaquinone biosynthesis C-methylase UbiE
LIHPEALKEAALSQYIFDNAAQLQANQRFSSLETLYDPWTISHLERTGVGPGWHCWEVGAGGGSIAAWLAQRCGPSGYVLVTDIDERFLVESAALHQPMIEIQRHDIVADPLPARSFDLIHVRLVLFHVPAREQALARMVAALKPGGWIVIEAFDRNFNDFSYPSTNAEGAALYQKMQTVLGHLMEARGVDPVRGRSLYRRLRALGLVDVGMEGYMAAREGGSAGARLARANFEQIRQEATAAGLITDKEVAQMFTLLDDPDFAYGSHIMFTAWGRRPQS